MSLKSKLALKMGLSDINTAFTNLYIVGFEFQRLFDFNKERKKLMAIIRDYTHVNYPRLKFLYEKAQELAQSGTEGAFVETGVWKGGCAGILTFMSQKYGYKQPLYFFDSFEGLPQPTNEDGEDAKVFSNNISEGILKSIQKVKAEDYYIKELLFNKLQVKPAKVFIVKGWFQDTLPIYSSKINKISLLRLDGDWYESTKVALENLYNLVIPGGYIIIDDYYYWDGCKKAVDEFLTKNNISVKIKRQDSSGAYFIKP